MPPWLPALANFPRRVVPLVFAVILGLSAVALIQAERARLYKQIEQERQRLLADYQSPMQIIVAAQDIQAGKILAEADLEFSSVPEKFVQPYASQYGGDLIGMVALAPIAKGEQVLSNKLRRATDLPTDATLSGLTPEGQRAVTIEVEAKTGVGGFVRPGDHVDVLWTVRLPKEQGGDPVAVTLFQDILVLAVGTEMLGKATSDKESSSVYNVTLALGPQETALLLYAREQAPLQLSLRARSDQSGVVAVSPANSLLMTKAILGDQPQAPPPKPPRTVEVIKGSEKTLVTLDE